MNSVKSKIGINLKKVSYPTCKTEQPVIKNQKDYMKYYR